MVFKLIGFLRQRRQLPFDAAPFTGAASALEGSCQSRSFDGDGRVRG
jgi:hypothetical protein